MKPAHEVKYWDVKVRRDRLRDLKLCINGPDQPGVPSRRSRIVHGPVVRGGKCARCLEIWEKSR